MLKPRRVMTLPIRLMLLTASIVLSGPLLNGSASAQMPTASEMDLLGWMLFDAMEAGDSEQPDRDIILRCAALDVLGDDVMNPEEDAAAVERWVPRAYAFLQDQDHLDPWRAASVLGKLFVRGLPSVMGTYSDPGGAARWENDLPHCAVIESTYAADPPPALPDELGVYEPIWVETEPALEGRSALTLGEPRSWKGIADQETFSFAAEPGTRVLVQAAGSDHAVDLYVFPAKFDANVPANVAVGGAVSLEAVVPSSGVMLLTAGSRSPFVIGVRLPGS